MTWPWAVPIIVVDALCVLTMVSLSRRNQKLHRAIRAAAELCNYGELLAPYEIGPRREPEPDAVIAVKLAIASELSKGLR